MIPIDDCGKLYFTPRYGDGYGPLRLKCNLSTAGNTCTSYGIWEKDSIDLGCRTPPPPPAITTTSTVTSSGGADETPIIDGGYSCGEIISENFPSFVRMDAIEEEYGACPIGWSFKTAGLDLKTLSRDYNVQDFHRACCTADETQKGAVIGNGVSDGSSMDGTPPPTPSTTLCCENLWAPPPPGKDTSGCSNLPYGTTQIQCESTQCYPGSECGHCSWSRQPPCV